MRSYSDIKLYKFESMSDFTFDFSALNADCARLLQEAGVRADTESSLKRTQLAKLKQVALKDQWQFRLINYHFALQELQKADKANQAACQKALKHLSVCVDALVELEQPYELLCQSGGGYDEEADTDLQADNAFEGFKNQVETSDKIKLALKSAAKWAAVTAVVGIAAVVIAAAIASGVGGIGVAFGLIGYALAPHITTLAGAVALGVVSAITGSGLFGFLVKGLHSIAQACGLSSQKPTIGHVVSMDHAVSKKGYSHNYTAAPGLDDQATSAQDALHDDYFDPQFSPAVGSLLDDAALDAGIAPETESGSGTSSSDSDPETDNDADQRFRGPNIRSM